MPLPIPSFVSAGAPNASTGAVNIVWPAGTYQAYDVGVLLLETSNETISVPSGWSEIVNSPQGFGISGVDATATRLTGLWKYATSAAEPTVTVADPGDHVLGDLLVFRGCDPTYPFDVTAGDFTLVAGTGVNVPALSTTTDNCLVVFAASEGVDNSVTRFNAWSPNAVLSNFTGLANFAFANGDGGGISAAAGGLASAGTSSAATTTLITSSLQGRLTFAFRPGVAPSSGATRMVHELTVESAFVHPLTVYPLTV